MGINNGFMIHFLRISKSVTVPAKSEVTLNIGICPLVFTKRNVFYACGSSYIVAAVADHTTSNIEIVFYSLKSSNNTTINVHNLVAFGY